jgi:hypothetical protein
MKPHSKKGLVAGAFIVMILLLLVGVIVVNLIFGLKGKPLQTLLSFGDAAEHILDTLGSLLGFGGDVTEEQREQDFKDNFNHLVEAYRSCSLSDKVGCYCNIGEGGVLFDEDFHVLLQQGGDNIFRFFPQKVGEDGYSFLVEDAVKVDGKICSVQDISRNGYPTFYDSLIFSTSSNPRNMHIKGEHQKDEEGKDILRVFYRHVGYDGDINTCFVPLDYFGDFPPYCEQRGVCYISDRYWSFDGKEPALKGDATSYQGQKVFLVIGGVGCEGKTLGVDILKDNEVDTILEGSFKEDNIILEYTLPSLNHNAIFTFFLHTDDTFDYAKPIKRKDEIYVGGNTCILNDVYWSTSTGVPITGDVVCIDNPGPYYMTVEGEQCTNSGLTLRAGWVSGNQHYPISSSTSYVTFTKNTITVPYTFPEEKLIEFTSFYFEAQVDDHHTGAVSSGRFPSPTFTEDSELISVTYC